MEIFRVFLQAKINVSDIFIIRIVIMCQHGFKLEGLKYIRFEIPTNALLRNHTIQDMNCRKMYPDHMGIRQYISICCMLQQIHFMIFILLKIFVP